MSSRTISSTVTSTVTIGPGSYPSVLTIAGTGQVAPNAYGAAGVYVDRGVVGVRILNQGEITVRRGGAIDGFGSVTGAPVQNGGTIDAAGGMLTLATAVGGAGTAEISANAVLWAQGGLANPVAFLSGGKETLALSDPLDATGTIAGFAATDTIDLLGVVATHISFSTTTDILTVTGASGTLAALHFAAGYTGADFARGTDHHGGTLITFT